MMNKISQAIADDWKKDPYYDLAENRLDPFWEKDSIFFKRFQELDLNNVVELACGHGRHVQKYIELSEEITLVDVNKENIDFCKQRFAGNKKIHYLVNSGNDFQNLPDNTYSAIFTYDSMIHFNLFDIANYIVDAWRILKPKGKILFHHSNHYNANIDNYYFQNYGGRNFCSDRIFAHFATVSGFKVLSQDVFSLGNRATYVKNIDCLSLCQKSTDYFSLCQKAMEERRSHAVAMLREKAKKRFEK